MSCKYINNNRESLIYDQLVEKYGDERALNILKSFETESFIQDFGDYIDLMQNPTDLIPSEFKGRINEYFEPLLLEDETGLYYLDKTFSKQYIDVSESKLNRLFSSQRAVNSLVELAASNFINDRGLTLMSDELEFLSDKNKISLKESLKNYLSILGGNLLESSNDDHFMNGVALGNILEDNATLDELQGRVIDYLKARKIQYAEELNEEEVDLLEEEVRDFNFSKASFEINTKSKVRANVKLILSLIKDPTTVEPDFGQSLPIDYTSLYNKLTNLLKDNPVTLEEVNGELKVEDLFNTYIDVLKSNVDNIQYLSPLIEFLEKINNLNDDISKKEGLKVFTFKAGFVQAFNLHKNYFNTKEVSSIEVEITPEVKATKMHPDGFPIQVTVKNAVKGPQPVYNQFDASKDTSTRKDLLNSWKLSILDKFGLNENNKVISEESRDKINKLKIKADLLIKDRKLSLEEKVDSFLNDILPSMGLNISKDEYAFGINKLSNQPLSESEYNNRQLEFLEEFNYILQHLIKNFNESRDLYPANHRIINNIIDSILYFRLDGSESSTYTGNKTKYNYSNPSYLHNVINSWKKNRDILQREYDNREVWSKKSKLYEYLLALDVEEENRKQVSESRINEFEIVHFNSFRDKNVKNSTHKDNRTITKAEYIKDTVNGLLFSRKGKNYSTYGRTTTAPGKSTQFEMKHSMFVDSELVYFNGEYDLTTLIDHFMYYLNAEFERMRDEHEYIKNNKNKLDVYYHTNVNGDLYVNNKLIGNAFKSQLFPSLSFDQINKHININPKVPLYNADGSINFENVAYYEEDIRKHIENVIKEKLNELKQDLINYNILEISEENVYRNKGIDGDILKTYSPSGVFISETNLQKLLGDLLLNGTINHIEYSKLFSGDIAYYKNPVDYIKRIGASYSDGIYEYLSEKTKDFNIAVINSVEIVTHYLDELKQVIKSDENLMKAWTDLVNSADAQAWITPQRWMNLLVGTSKFTEKHRVVYNKLINNELLSEDELKIAAQPLKGVYFQRDSKGKPIFLKYSQAVLIPQLTANSSLKELSKLMEVNKVDELLTFDAIKAGSLIPTTIHDENGNPTIYEEDRSVKKLNVMTLDSRGWKLQQDLPTKGFKELPIGTQLLRNMLLLLSDKIKSKEKVFEYNGETYTTEEYAKLIDNTLGNLIRDNYEGLLKEFNIDSEGVINNIEAFYNTLADELVSRDISDELVKALRAKLSIFAFPGLKSKLDNIFSSIVKKRTVDIKTNGGAFIQMSNFGLSKQEADSKYGEGIKWHPSVEKNGTTRPYRYKLDENGEVVKNIFGDPIIEPEQILISGSFIAKYIPDYQKYSSEELFKMIDEKILNNIIGYRIPNQGPSSNGALQVVGILPASVGDTIVAFTGITKKTGSDKISLFDPV